MFKWAVLKAGSAIARNTSTLFFHLLYREVFRQVHDLTQDNEETIKETFKLGYLGAEESAERQKIVFKLFPEKPEKILEYIPLLWQIIFGMPMEDYIQEWDKTDSQRPILRYKSRNNPLIFGIGTDKNLDNLPWKNLWDGKNSYSAIITGMLTQVSSYILKLKNSEKAIIISESQSLLRGDPYFELSCQIIPANELPLYAESIKFSNKVSSEDSEIEQNKSVEDGQSTESSKKNESEPRSAAENLIDKLTKNITIDKLEEIFSKPMGFAQVSLKNVIESTLHMEPQELIDHFTNYEHDFIRVIGFLTVHIFNEMGQITQKMFENDKIARVFGHIFILLRDNANRYISHAVISDIKKLSLNLLETLSPVQFQKNLQAIDPKEFITDYFEGVQKALQDLGIQFNQLKKNLFEEFKSTENPQLPQEKNDERNKIIFDIVQESFILAVAIFNIPTQFVLLLSLESFTGTNEIMGSFLKTVDESSRKIVDLAQKIKE